MNTAPEVDAFLDRLQHPLKPEIQAVRAIILKADLRVTETIKWGGPSFIYRGTMATLNPRAKRAATLFFQTGALLPNPFGLLEGDATLVRVARFRSMDDVRQKASALESAVHAWITLMNAIPS